MNLRIKLNNYKTVNFTINLVIFFIGILFSLSTQNVFAATVLSDDFTGTTIDTNKWSEVDAGGVGGSSGNIRQSDSLTVTGSGTWGANYLLSTSTHDRSLGDLELEADVTCTANGIPGIGYGDPGVLTGGGQSYTLYIANRAVYFSRQQANTNQESINTGWLCTAGVPFHIRIVIDDTIGATLYINGSGTAAATLTGGTFNNKSFFLEGHSGTATTIDNLVINGPNAATEPGVPTDLNAIPASTQVALSWTAPANNGGSSITDYLVEYKLSSEPTTWSTFADGTSSSTTATVTSLTNDLSYDFRVSAINSIGTSEPSGTDSATPALSAPSAPRSLISIAGNTQVELSWTIPLSNGGASITDYIVQYKLSSEPSTWSTFSDGISTSTTSTVTGLTNDLSYDFRVLATNSIGNSVASNTSTTSPAYAALIESFIGTTIDTNKWVEYDSDGIGGTTGSVIQNNALLITPNNGSWSNQDGVSTVATYDRTNGDVSMEISVTRDSCGVGVGPVAFGYGDINFTTAGSASYIFLSNVTGWELYYWLGGGNQAESPVLVSGLTSCTNGVPINFRLVALQSGGAEVYVNGAATPSATYNLGTFTNKSFWIGGYQSGGVVTYDDITIIEPVTGPFAPNTLQATASSGQVSLSWVSGGNNGSEITDYLIEYKQAQAGSWSTFSDGTSTGTTATVTGLTNGSLYNFRVLAVNANGTSDPSSTASATPLSSTPTVPTATSVAITGSASLGELLTGTYTYNDVNGNTEAASTYRWLRADSAGGVYVVITGATSINYTVTSDDLTKYLKFEVTPVSNTSPTTGSAALSSATPQVSEIDYINQILSTGQSLSVGVASSPSLTTTQPYSNLMLTGGTGGMGAGGSFTPLIEGGGVETISSSMANTITANDAGNDFDVVVSLHGVSGYTYSQLKKGTGPFTNAMNQVTNVKSAAIALGRTSRVIGVTNIHGETDNYNGVSGATYQGYLEEWQNDYDTDVKAITGQNNEVIMFIDQMSSFMSSYANDATSEIPIYQLYASEDNPTEIVLVAPKYFFNYSDRHHLTGASSRWLGEYYGKVIKKVVIDHEAWRPLSPDSAIRSANVIDVNFHVPAGVLAFDTTLVSARTNYGFEYYDSTASATISSVVILDSDTVRITLSGTPTGSNQRIRYAYTGVPGTNTGAQNAGSAAGNLRDTDPYPSLYGNTLYNWAVHFDEAIVLDSTSPTITNFTIPQTANSLTIDVASFTATDDTSVAGYLLTESSDVPNVGDSEWTVNAPATYTFSTRGNKTLYAWTKDSAGNISTSLNDSITITLVPNPPTGITATAGNTQAVVTFSAPVDNGGAEITGYIVTSSPAGGTDSNAGLTNLTHTIIGLTNGQTYTFTVTATNTAGTSVTSIASNQVTPSDADEPIISAVSSTPNDTSVTITWTTNESSSSIVDYGLTNTYGTSTAEADTSPRVTSHSVRLDNLIACTTYNYRVKSNDAANNLATGSNNTFTTTGCTAGAEVLHENQDNIETALGGEVELLSGLYGIGLNIPAGATNTDAVFQIKQLDSADVLLTTGTPEQKSLIGDHTYELKSLSDVDQANTSFNEAITVTLTYSDSDVSGIDESTLLIYRYDGTNWNALQNCSVNTNLNTVTCTTVHFSTFGLFGSTVTTTTPIVSGGGGVCYGCHLKPVVPKGGFKVVINSGATTISKSIVTLNFNARSDVKKMAISLTGDFGGVKQEKYSPTKQIDLCSKFTWLAKNLTCPDGQYTVYVKFYTQYGRSSDVISTKVNLATSPQFSGPTQTFTKDLLFGSNDSQVKFLQQFLNQNGFELANSGVGSTWKETDYFGQLTVNALAKFQEANSDKVTGLMSEKGFLGPITREFINSSTNIKALVTSTQTTQNTTSAIFTTPLFKGMQSEDVRRLQVLLATHPEIYPEGSITGYFGALTEKAIQIFQLKYGLVTSSSDPGFGYVGPKTRAKLQEVFGN